MSKHIIIFGHGEGDPGTTAGVFKSERAHLEDIAREMKSLISDYHLDQFEVIDNINVYARNDFAKNPKKYQNAKSVTEVHLNAENSGVARGGEIIFGKGLVPDEIDERLKKYLTEMMGWRRWIISDYYQNPREAKRLGINYRLIEIGFLTNYTDASKIYTFERIHAQKILEAIGNIKLEKEEILPFTTNFIIQFGAFNDYKNAENELEKIKKHYPSAWIRRVK